MIKGRRRGETPTLERITAIHEAGHVVVSGYALGHGFHRASATIIPGTLDGDETPYLGLVIPSEAAQLVFGPDRVRPGAVYHSEEYAEALDYLTHILAGPAAECYFMGHRFSTSYSVWHYLKQEGKIVELAEILSPTTDEHGNQSARKIREQNRFLCWLGDRTMNIVTRSDVWGAIVAVADALMEHKTLDGYQLLNAVNGSIYGDQWQPIPRP